MEEYLGKRDKNKTLPTFRDNHYRSVNYRMHEGNFIVPWQMEGNINCEKYKE
jgi:hypothetical protein